mgnify:CR=1 FL=1
MEKIIKKVMIICMVTCILIIQTIGQCRAEGENVEITKIASKVFPFHYGEEPKQTYRILQCGDKVAYTLNRSIYPIGNNYSEIEPYNNNELIRIIEAGYPNIEIEKLGLSSSEQAYVVTQEAIYATLENKDLTLYEKEASLGTKMIDAIKKISSEVSENDIALREKNKGWIDDEVDSNYCYKEYRVTMKSRIIENSISLFEGENCKITNEQGDEITEILDNQTIRLTVPKGKEQTINVKVNYIIETPKVYKVIDDNKNEYLIVDFYNENRQYEYKVNTKKTVLLNIKNYNKETNLPIKGNKFQVLDKNKNVCIKCIETNEDGRVGIYMPIGNFYLKQIETQEGNLQKEMINVNITGDEEVVVLNVFNTTLKKEETVENEIEINLEEENKQIVENHIKDISNIHTSNIEKEIINQTNETNMHNINYFINTINRKNIANLTKENTYENEIFEDTIYYERVLPGESSKTTKTRREYQNYVDSIKNSTILPVAYKK